MSLIIKAYSSLEKIKRSENLVFPEISEMFAVRGERISFQLAVKTDSPVRLQAKTTLTSSLGEHVRIFRQRDVYCDTPSTGHIENEDYLLTEPGFLPDVLIPLAEQNDRFLLADHNTMLWVRIDVPHDFPTGDYPVTVRFDVERFGGPDKPFYDTGEITVMIRIKNAVMPSQKLIYTRWLYLDCIANVHHVPIFSEEHWSLIDSYLEKARDIGVNMMLLCVHTPPLDTEVGTARPCVQLVDIEKNEDRYEFSFSRFERFVSLCQKHGFEYYEMAHMFSQWGAAFAPNIRVKEHGKESYLFGWHTPAESEEYIAFLRQYIAAIAKELERLGIAEKTYFHISDEPTTENMEKYAHAKEIFSSLVGKSKIFDALSHIDFYEKGLVTTPVTIIDCIHEFLKHEIEDQWLYYCCIPEHVFPNAFIAMPLSRVRVIGVLMYKYHIKGFLHWGFNFYNAARSKYAIDPYLTTSADGSFASGDAYIVYPAPYGAYGSIRGEATYDAIQDMMLCEALEEKIGRDAVIALIDQEAGKDLRFDDYPNQPEFLLSLRKKLIEALTE